VRCTQRNERRDEENMTRALTFSSSFFKRAARSASALPSSVALRTTPIINRAQS
jgi:hypothetical protein